MARNEIKVSVVGDTKDIERALGRVGRSADTNFKKLGRAAGIAGAALGGALFLGARAGFEELSEAARVGAQTNAVIESTGGVANVTAGHVSKLAEELMELSGVDDEAIASGQNLLLTFKNIRNEAGSPIFDRATKATLDFAVAMGKEVPDAALVVGKALNMPTRGVTKLERAGVQFTDKQKEMIKALEESGDVAGAQRIILKELESQFGGSAKAAGETLPGKLAIAKESFRNMAGALMESLIPALTVVADNVKRVADFFREHPALLKAVVIGVGALAVALMVASVASTLLNLSLLANPVGLVIIAIVALIAGLVILYKKFETVRNIVDFVREHWKLLLFAFGLLPGVIMLIIDNFGTLKAKAMPIINAIKEGFDKVKAAAAAVKDFITGTLWPAVRPILARIRDGVNTVRDAFQAVIDKVQVLIGWIGRIPKPSLPDLTPGFDLPGFATGGVVPGPRGAARLAVVHGGETVLPTHRRSAGSGGGGGGRMEIALIAAGPDVIRALRELDRRSKLSGGLGLA